MRAFGAVLVLALSALALAAGTARAITVTEYEVTVDGEATYARTDTYAVAPAGSQVDREKARFKWRSRLPSVTFYDKQIAHTSESSTQVSDIVAAMDVTLSTPAGTASGSCSGTTLAAPPSGVWLGEGTIPTPDPTVESLDVRVLGGVLFHLPSCSGLYGPGPMTLGIGSDRPTPMGPFDQMFDLPHEAIGMGKIIQLLDANHSGQSCPGHHKDTTSCSLAWKATVTFARTNQWQTDPPPAPPVVDDGLIPTPPTGPDASSDDSLIPTPPRAKLTPDASRAELSFTCRAACTGTAVAYAARKGPGARASAPRLLATAAFKGTPNRPIKTVLRFNPRARRAIERAGGVRIDLRISSAGVDKPVRRSMVLRFERPRP